MADKNKIKRKKAQTRRRRVRAKVVGTAGRPRLSVAKSLRNISVQIIDDEKEITLASASSLSKDVISELKDAKNKVDAAHRLGGIIARMAKEKGIEEVVFDRNRNRYHGRIKAVAEGAREGGLKF